MTKVLIPEDALLQHIAFLGKTGAGKTTAAKGRIEELLLAGRRCCVIDPTDVWWGLRLNKKGDGPGLSVVLFGGKRGDVPITEHDGEKVARLVATSDFSCVIATKGMTVSGRTRFFTAFATTLFQLNERPLHLVIDEAHVFAPKGKVPSPQAGMMLHATNELVSGGRSQGLRIMLLTQRPAKLHNDSLTQVETLVAMRMLAPHDRKAVQDWIGEWGDDGSGKKIMSELASLPRGVAWVWYPEDGYLARVQFPPAATFDSSRAPVEGDEERKPMSLEELPLDDIRAAFTAPVPAEAPSAPKGTVTEAAMKAALAENSTAMFAEGKRAGSVEGHAEGVRVGISQALGELRPIIARLEALAYGEKGEPEPEGPKIVQLSLTSRTAQAVKNLKEPMRGSGMAWTRDGDAPQPPAFPTLSDLKAARNHVERDVAVVFAPTAPQQRILDALLWGEALLQAPDLGREIVAWLADASPKASGFQNNLGALRSGGVVDYPSGGRVMLTDAGRKLAQPPTETPTREALFAAISSKLSKPQSAIFDVATFAWPRHTTREAIAHQVQKSVNASGFQNDLGRLRTLGLITYPVPGQVRAADYLFGKSADA